MPNGSLRARKPAEPAKEAGIAPRLEPEGTRRRAHAQGRDLERKLGEEASAFERGLRESGEAFGRSRDPKGISRDFDLALFLERREGFGPASFERATGEASASMRA
jgi:hypothetical protein